MPIYDAQGFRRRLRSQRLRFVLKTVGTVSATW